VIPIALGLLDDSGAEILPTQILEMEKRQQSFKWEGLASKPVPSILRGFSAPVILKRDTNDAERAFLLAHDTDPFNRWEAGRELAKSTLLAMIEHGASPNAGYLDGMLAVLRDEALDPATRALMLGLPSQSELTQTLADKGSVPDPQAIYEAVQTLLLAMAQHMQDTLPRIYAQCQVAGPYSPDAQSAGKRELAIAALGLGSRLDGGKAAKEQFAQADNMTLQVSALAILLRQKVGDAPNRFRATLGALAGHHAGFHHVSGRGYTLLADWLITLDPINPQTTARMCAAFQTWKRYDPARQNMIKAEVERILAQPSLSRDTSEMLTRIRSA